MLEFTSGSNYFSLHRLTSCNSILFATKAIIYLNEEKGRAARNNLLKTTKSMQYLAYKMTTSVYSQDSLIYYMY